MAAPSDDPSSTDSDVPELPALVQKPTAPHGGRLPPDVLPNGTMVGEYRVDRMLGEGGMGAVYAATHPIIGKRVAIKVLKSALSTDPGLVRRFVDEARAVNRIGHPNIIDIFSFGQLSDGRQYFVMEFLEGETLAARLAAGSLVAEETHRWLQQTCAALAAAHRENVVHRDLKPENIWIARPRHGDSFVKMLDFGIAKLLDADTLNVTQTGVTMGTPMYMSPEQCIGQGVDHRTDIYALGAIFYQIFAGRLPFEGRSFAEVVAQQLSATPPPPVKWKTMPQALNDLILSCLEKDAARRPQTAAEVGQRLAAAVSVTEQLPTKRDVKLLVEPAHAETVAAVATADTKLGYEDARDEGKRLLGSSAPAPGSTRWVVVAAAAAVALGVIAAIVLARRPPDAALLPSAAPPPARPAQPPIVITPIPAAAPATPAAPAEASRARPAAKAPTNVPSRRRTERKRVDDKGLVTDNPFK